MEPIEVIATFGKDGIFPRIIKWGQHTYKINSVNLVHAIKDGAIRVYFFSVFDGANSWKLGFNTESLKWWVEDFFQE